jgi:hypothetical protein
MKRGMQGLPAIAALTGVLILVAAPGVARASPLLAQNWRELSPGERYETLRNYRQHERLPEDSRRDIERRYERWQRMSPDERDRIRQNYERLRHMPPPERDRLQRKYDKWRQQREPSP